MTGSGVEETTKISKLSGNSGKQKRHGDVDMIPTFEILWRRKGWVMLHGFG